MDDMLEGIVERSTRFVTPQGSLFVTEHADGTLTIGTVYLDGTFRSPRMTLDKQASKELRALLGRRGPEA